MPCSSCARAREGAGEFLQHHRGAPQTPGACSAPRWFLGRWPGAGRGGAAQLPEANRGEHGLGDSSCPNPAPSHSQHEKGEEKSLPQHRQRRALEATSTLQDGHTALEARDGGSSARLGGTELLGRCGGEPGHSSAAAPRGDPVLWGQAPGRQVVAAVRVPVLGALGRMAPLQFSAFCAPVALEAIKFSA